MRVIGLTAFPENILLNRGEVSFFQLHYFETIIM